MSSKNEYDENKRMRDLRDRNEEALLNLGTELGDLLKRLVVAMETIASKP